MTAFLSRGHHSFMHIHSVSRYFRLLIDCSLLDDPANPQNWSSKKKLFVSFQIW